MASAQSQKPYDSAEDSGDDIFDDYDADNTVATVPLPPRSRLYPRAQTQQSKANGTTQNAATYITQPTQRLSPSPSRRTASPAPVQVAASSPVSQSPRGPSAPSMRQGALNGGVLAISMAPPGTQFRPPWQRSQAAPATQMSQGLGYSDDERHVDISSDDDDQPGSADIRPSTFERGGKPVFAGQTNRVEESPRNNGPAFKTFASRYAYNPNASPQKRSVDALANAYSSSRPAKAPRQTAPARAQPVQQEMTMNDIQDWDVRSKIDLMMQVFPAATVRQCLNALKKCHSNEADAIALIAKEEEEKELRGNAVDLTATDDEKADATDKSKPNVKRHVQAPTKSIANKWGSTPMFPKESAAPQSPTLVNTPPKARRRLVPARRADSSPVASSPARPPVSKAKPVAKQPAPADDDEEEEEAEDSGLGSGSEEEEDVQDAGQTAGLLKYINKCSRVELLDLSSQPADVVDLVMSKRPFGSLEAVRAISIESTTKTRNGKKRTTNKQVGDRLMDVCLEMWSGYNAVDQLVAKCEELGRPIGEEMKKWGFDAFGASNAAGELELVDLDGLGTHDSGIGTPASSADEGLGGAKKGEASSKSNKSTLIRQPALMSRDLTLKDYQLAGINWLALLFSRKLSCILADDMGLGKTCQVIAFLAHLHETGVKGPHLIVVPGSTLENWLREFSRFCPALRVQPYYGDQKERAELRFMIEEERDEINVVITTYDQATKVDDARFLRKIVNPVVCVYDEGHYLRNSQTDRYKKLMRIPAEFRLLLTGTPLQNNLQELVSLLAFIMPQVFQDRAEDLQYIFKHKAKTTDTDHTALLSSQRIDRARSMMTPFILRRKKHQVLKHLPKKVCRVEYCDMTDSQKAIYEEESAKVRMALLEGMAESGEGKRTRSTAKLEEKTKSNVLMELRKAAIHPLLFRRRYDDETIRKMSKACIKEPALRESNPELVFEDMTVMTDFELNRFCESNPKTMRQYQFKKEPDPSLDSGKVAKLVDLLLRFRDNGDRTLVFSQFRIVLDILEKVMETLSMQYSRLDGTTRVAERQDLIDQFHQDTSIPVFMLSTKAGGAGINLECANKVIIFDSSFNPQDDVQAENRAHRVGQTRDVEVVRLVTRGTIEEQILTLGESKLAMDERVAGTGEAGGDAADGVPQKVADEAIETEGMHMVEQMMKEQLTGGEPARDGTPAVKEEDEGDKDQIGLADRTSPRAARSGDLKDEYLQSLKAAGLDVSAAN